MGGQSSPAVVTARLGTEESSEDYPSEVVARLSGAQQVEYSFTFLKEFTLIVSVRLQVEVQAPDGTSVLWQRCLPWDTALNHNRHSRANFFFPDGATSANISFTSKTFKAGPALNW